MLDWRVVGERIPRLLPAIMRWPGGRRAICTLVLPVVLLVGCMTSSARRWNGHAANELLAVRGAARETLALGGGGTLYIYESKWNSSSAGVCELRFVTDAAGVIRDTRLFNCRWNGWVAAPPSTP